jgi:hypothetical protein
MTIEDRANLFGDPSELLVAEAIWSFEHVNEYWPGWDEALEAIADLAECGEEEAERRLIAAINGEEVTVLLPDDIEAALFPDTEWEITLDQETADRIERRYLEMTMKRRNREEA